MSRPHEHRDAVYNRDVQNLMRLRGRIMSDPNRKGQGKEDILAHVDRLIHLLLDKRDDPPAVEVVKTK